MYSDQPKIEGMDQAQFAAFSDLIAGLLAHAAIVPLEPLHAYVATFDQAHAIGPIMHPTGYRR